MRILKNFSEFIKESNQSIGISIDDVMSFFKKRRNITDIFDVEDKHIDINNLYNDSSFNDTLREKKMKKSELQNNNISEMLINPNYKFSFFTIFNADQIKIQEPLYVIMQYFDKSTLKRSEIKLFQNDNQMNDFYSFLTNTSYEINDNGQTYVYSTSNAGNNWELKNLKMVDKNHPKELDKDNFDKMIKKY